jgi:flagellar L-ring protein precursor FlgH
MTRYLFPIALVAVLLFAAPFRADAQGKKEQQKADNYDVLLQRYLESARQPPQPPPTQATWMGNLMLDPRARQVNDLVTVRVLESMSALGSADASLSKDSGGSAGVNQFFGLQDKLPGFIDPTNLFGAGASSEFQGSGTTTRVGELTAVLTARVAEVLPNGDLVLEGVREVDINGDRQIVVLTGVVRTMDVRPGNIVLSPSIGQMRIRYFGRGLIKDSLSPGWLIRILNKIF